MIEIEGEDVADGVGIFDAIEAMDRRGAGIGFDGEVVVECLFDVREECAASFIREFGTVAGRHLATTDFTKNLFPFGDCGGDVGGLQALEREVAGFEIFVVTAEAGSVERFLCRVGRSGLRESAV